MVRSTKPLEKSLPPPLIELRCKELIKPTKVGFFASRLD